MNITKQLVNARLPHSKLQRSLLSDASQPFSVFFLCSSWYHSSAGNISQCYFSRFEDKMSDEVGLITVVFGFEYSVVAY